MSALVTDEVQRGLIPWTFDGLVEAWRFLGQRAVRREYENALTRFLRGRYSPQDGVAHFWRFGEIDWFLEHWGSRLRAARLIRGGRVSGRLLAVLAEAPFTTTRRYGADYCWTFDLDTVLARIEGETEK